MQIIWNDKYKNKKKRKKMNKNFSFEILFLSTLIIFQVIIFRLDANKLLVITYSICKNINKKNV